MNNKNTLVPSSLKVLIKSIMSQIMQKFDLQKNGNCNFSSDNTHKPYMFLYALYGLKNLSLKNLHYQFF